MCTLFQKEYSKVLLHSGLGFRLNRLQIQINRYFIADIKAAACQRVAVIDTVLAAVNPCVHFNAKTSVTPRVLDRAGKGEREFDLFVTPFIVKSPCKTYFSLPFFSIRVLTNFISG